MYFLKTFIFIISGEKKNMESKVLLEGNVPYIEIVPYQDEDQDATNDADSKGKVYLLHLFIM